MIPHLNFPAYGAERMTIINNAETCEHDWSKLTEREKIIFVQGMDRGYYQGKREQAQAVIDKFTQEIVGFKP